MTDVFAGLAGSSGSPQGRREFLAAAPAAFVAAGRVLPCIGTGSGRPRRLNGENSHIHVEGRAQAQLDEGYDT